MQKAWRQPTRNRPVVPMNAPSAAGASSVATFATGVPSLDSERHPSSSNNGQLLDLADLDAYLLSLLSADLAGFCKSALAAQRAIETAVNGDTNRESSDEDEATTGTDESRSRSRSLGWWNWEDVLALVTICASQGQTPGARALGYTLVERGPVQQQRHRNSFWWWILTAMRGQGGNESLHPRSNTTTTTRFRYKILLYAFLRVVLPRVYERLKSKGLDYVHRKHPQEEEDETENERELLSLRLQPQRDTIAKDDSFGNANVNENPPRNTQQNETGTSSLTAKSTASLARERRQRVVSTAIRWLDGAILPGMRLALLLSCWTQRRNRTPSPTDAGHGGNLALWMSGLSYRAAEQSPLPTTTASRARMTLPLFVLYAHRRWFHREALQLLWNQLGRSLLRVHGETSELGRVLWWQLATEWRMLRVRWSYQRETVSQQWWWFFVPGRNRSTKPIESTSSRSTKKEPPCILCHADPIVVPYRLECCGKVACYVCLWDRLASKALSSTTNSNNSNNVESFSCPVCRQRIPKCVPCLPV